MAKTAVIVGAGPGLGLSIARKFGRRGMKVALIARKREKLDHLSATLNSEGVTAESFVGDVSDEGSICRALQQAEDSLGPIEVMEYSPLPGMGRDQNLMSALGTTADQVERQFRRLVFGAVTCVRQVVPGMLARKSGAVLITTSGSGYFPMEIATPIGMAMAAARQYAHCLNRALVGTGVYAGTVCIAVVIRRGDALADPDAIATLYEQLYDRRDRAEIILQNGDPLQVHADELRAQGIEPVFGTQARV